MAKSIRCSDAGKNCGWSATAESEHELMEQVILHVKEEHQEIELNDKTISQIKSLIRDTC